MPLALTCWHLTITWLMSRSRMAILVPSSALLPIHLTNMRRTPRSHCWKRGTNPPGDVTLYSRNQWGRQTSLQKIRCEGGLLVWTVTSLPADQGKRPWCTRSLAAAASPTLANQEEIGNQAEGCPGCVPEGDFGGVSGGSDGRTTTQSNGRKSQWLTRPDFPKSCYWRKESTSRWPLLRNTSTGTGQLSFLVAGWLMDARTNRGRPTASGYAHRPLTSVTPINEPQIPMTMNDTMWAMRRRCSH